MYTNNTTTKNRNPYNYMSKDWSENPEQFNRMIEDKFIIRNTDCSDSNFVPGEETRDGILGRIINHVWVAYND